MHTGFQAKLTHFKTGIAVLVAVLLALRVVAQPLLLAAPEPGLMAICSGGQIVYVSIETGQPVVTGETGQIAADPCPFAHVTAFDLASQPSMPKHAFGPGLLADWPQSSGVTHAWRDAHNSARAPPA